MFIIYDMSDFLTRLEIMIHECGGKVHYPEVAVEQQPDVFVDTMISTGMRITDDDMRDLFTLLAPSDGQIAVCAPNGGSLYRLSGLQAVRSVWLMYFIDGSLHAYTAICRKDGVGHTMDLSRRQKAV